MFRVIVEDGVAIKYEDEHGRVWFNQHGEWVLTPSGTIESHSRFHPYGEVVEQEERPVAVDEEET